MLPGAGREVVLGWALKAVGLDQRGVGESVSRIEEFIVNWVGVR